LLDRKVALIGLAFGVLGLVISLFLRYGIGLALSVLIPCLVYLLLRTDSDNDMATLQSYFIGHSKVRIVHLVGLVLTAVLFVISVFFLRYSRPVGYFVFASAISVVISIEIVTLPKKPSLAQVGSIILQMSLLFASLSWGVILEFPGLPLYDPWYHEVLTQYIINNGHVIPSTFIFPFSPDQAAQDYSPFPFFHIIVATTSLVAGILSYKMSVIGSIGLFQIASLLFVFLSAKKILLDIRLALFAMFFVGISDWSITYGIYLIPQTLGYGLFALLFFLLIRNAEKPTRTNLVLIFATFLVILFSHTVTTFISLLLITIFFASSFLYPYFIKGESVTVQRRKLSFVFVLAIFASVLTYWVLFTSFLVQRTRSFIENITKVSGVAEPIATSYFHYEFNQIGIYLLWFLAIVGCLLWLRSKKASQVKFSILCSFCFLALFMYTATVAGLTTFIPERWFVFVFILGAIPAAEGLNLIRKRLRRRWLLVLTCCLIFSLAFFMISAGDANLDNALFGKDEVTAYSYTQSEMTAANTITHFFNGTIYTDSDFSTYFIWSLNVNITILNLTNPTLPGEGVVIIRQYIFDHPDQAYSDGPYIRVNSTLLNMFQQANKIYSNGQVDAYAP